MINNLTPTCQADLSQVNRNELNVFLANLGSRTVSGLPVKDRANYLNYVPLQQRTFHLNPTDAIEVISVINKLASKTAASFDGISTKCLQAIIAEIALPLVHIFNRSFESGIVPCKLKMAKVVPVYKSGNVSLPID
jgi:hypothetical protein